MNHPEPGLFELSEPEPQAPPQRPKRRPQRGRNRETWVLTVAAEVCIVDAVALDEAASRAEANTVMITSSADSFVDDDPSPQQAVAESTARALDQLAGLIWPTDGQEPLIDADAFRIVSVESEVVGESADRGTATWTVTVKLTHVDRLRRLATQAHREDAALIADNFALAWQHAADPFAPLRSIPGIEWRPLAVDAEHLPAKSRPPQRRAASSPADTPATASTPAATRTQTP